MESYNNLYMQPLKEEQFINKEKVPDKSLLNDSIEDNKEYQKQCRRYAEAEKKVIFKGWKVKNATATSDNWIIQFRKDTNFLSYQTNNSFGPTTCIKTIEDLFEATNGELETQNIMSINEEIKEALTELVRLKDYKKKHGKDDRYVVEQPFAWKRARKVLKKDEESKTIIPHVLKEDLHTVTHN